MNIVWIQMKDRTSVSAENLLESLTTGTFLHGGGLLSVSGLDQERVFLAQIFNLSSARITTDKGRVK